MSQPRGIRNHNPGNVEHVAGVRWQGAVGHDGRFVKFESAVWGIRAIARILITYQDKRRAADGTRIDAVDEVIDRWAPPNENNTDAYAAHVASQLGVAVAAEGSVDVYNYDTMLVLVMAIIKHENGVMPYTQAQLQKGLALAGLVPKAEPLKKSGTVKGAQIATAGTAIEAARQEGLLDTVASWLPWAQGLVPYLPYVGGGLVTIGILYIIWRRYDDHRKLVRP